jgi:hypothetical protein
MNNEKYLKLLIVLIWLTGVLIFYFTGLHTYEHKSVVGMKIYEEPKLMLYRYKSKDLELTPEEFASLSVSYPKETYVSDPVYTLIIDGKRFNVKQEQYNKYNEGDSITYYEKYFIGNPSLEK